MESGAGQNVYDKFLNQGVALHREGKFDEAINIYNSLLGRKLNHHLVLYLLGDCFLRKGLAAISIQLFQGALQTNPGMQEAWQDMGVALKQEHYEAEALKAWEKALELGEKPEIYINLASLYSDHGDPEKGLLYSDKAIALGHNGPESRWNRALALLSLHQWEEAWKEHETRRKLESYHERTDIVVPDWDGSHDKVVCVTGEQGVGDEIMFASCLNDLIAVSKHVVVECEKRLVPVFERAFGMPAYLSQAEIVEKNELPLDFKVPLGSLPMFFRNRDEDFSAVPYLVPDQAKVEEYRSKLEALGPGPYIGLSWTGGTKPTRIHERSMPPTKLERFRQLGTCVSLQYGEFAQADADRIGIHHFPGISDGTDMDNLIALIEALDVVVTVATTVVHAAGSIGKKTHVLVPELPSWRYNYDDGKYLPWYRDSKIHRQGHMERWESVIDRAYKEIENEYAERRIAAAG